jgi:exosortase
VLLLPLRVIHEINQDWPLITWPLALIVVFLTLYAFHLAALPSAVVPFSFSAFQRFSFLPSSPVSSPWLRHFAFPICFILVAVAWPYRIENTLTQGLMRTVTGLTATLLGWLDILASQHGNVIEISTGVVGIDEACSGIRSFQSMLMGALFLGELYRLRWPHRLALIGSGVVVAFFLNVVRTFILTRRASDVGIEAVAKWHDPAGLSIFLASFACLWLLAWRLRKKEVESPELIVDSRQPEVQTPNSAPQVSGFSPQPSSVASRPSPPPKNLCPSVVLFLDFGLRTSNFDLRPPVFVS